jgi:hypothetical protein
MGDNSIRSEGSLDSLARTAGSRAGISSNNNQDDQSDGRHIRGGGERPFPTSPFTKQGRPAKLEQFLKENGASGSLIEAAKEVNIKNFLQWDAELSDDEIHQGKARSCIKALKEIITEEEEKKQEDSRRTEDGYLRRGDNGRGNDRVHEERGSSGLQAQALQDPYEDKEDVSVQGKARNIVLYGVHGSGGGIIARMSSLHGTAIAERGTYVLRLTGIYIKLLTSKSGVSAEQAAQIARVMLVVEKERWGVIFGADWHLSVKEYENR